MEAQNPFCLHRVKNSGLLTVRWIFLPASLFAFLRRQAIKRESYDPLRESYRVENGAIFLLYSSESLTSPGLKLHREKYPSIFC